MYDIKDFTKEFKIYNTVEFKKLDNYDNYFIYEDGRILSIKRNIFLKFNDINGYCKVRLCDNNKKVKHFYSHRLVYETFKGFIPEGFEIDHINGIRNDNRLINLRLLTRKENKQNQHRLEQYKQISKKQYAKHKEQQKEYYNNNKDKIKEYYNNNKDKIKEYQKEYREKHKKYQKEYREKNKDKIKEYQKEYREKQKEYFKEYYKKIN